MTVKDAATNSLLMFVAATCVVLVVRALPQSQQPQQAEGSPTPPSTVVGKLAGTPTLAMQDGVKVYYLHGNTRCPTCRTIESYAQEAVQSGFADELKTGWIEWQVINYEASGNEHYATDYNVVAPNVVLVKLKGGKQIAWKALPEVWEHTGNKVAFLNFVQTSLRDFLQGSDSKTPAPPPPPPKPVALPQDSPLPLPE